MTAMTAIFKRELKGYFTTPVAYIYLVVFIVASAFVTFTETYFEGGDANLQPFFNRLPLFFVLLAPAIAMRMWAEERRTGTIELLLTLPVTTPQAVLGKFLAGWVFFLLALVLTLPIFFTVWWLSWPGGPEIGPVISGYFGAALMAASYLAISCFFSAITRSQPISFILGVVACWIFMSLSSPALLGVLPDAVADFFSSISFATHYDTIQRGVIELRNVFFLLIVTVGFLVSCNIMLDERKAQ